MLIQSPSSEATHTIVNNVDECQTVTLSLNFLRTLLSIRPCDGINEQTTFAFVVSIVSK
jgi:hypothetical protein